MNYNLKMEEILKSLKGKKKLLLHACCGPCSSYCLEVLSKYFDITIYYYNPNIHPNQEYYRRLNELKKFLNKFDNSIKLVEAQYIPDEYFKKIKGLESLGEKSKRCYECYKLRMDKACNYAKENKFEYFTTTLSISPHKLSNWINEIGEELQEKYCVKYLYADFKKNNGYKRSLEISKEYNMYRQEYCGCIYSKEVMLNRKVTNLDENN